MLLSIVPAAGEENVEHPTSSHSSRRCCITTGMEPFCSHALGAIDSAPQARIFSGHGTDRITSPPQAFNDRPAAGEENFEPLESWRCNHPQISPLSCDNKSPCASAQRRRRQKLSRPRNILAAGARWGTKCFEARPDLAHRPGGDALVTFSTHTSGPQTQGSAQRPR